MTKAWLFLFIAGALEVCWAIALKYSEGFTKVLPSIIFGITAWLGFACLAYAIKTLPLGTAYAAWTGIGAVGIALTGMGWLGEPITLPRLAFISLIVIGIVGLKLSDPSSTTQ